MARNFYIGDWHYGHANIIAYDNRPYGTVEEMNEDLIRRWNAAVTEKDSVYILGDMFWCTAKNALPVLDQLHGAKYLIRGNHDPFSMEFESKFVGVWDAKMIRDNGTKIYMSHCPKISFENWQHGAVHFYAHVHNSFEYNITKNVQRQLSELYETECRMINVGAMMPWMDYTPRTAEEILEAVYGRA